MNKFALGCGVLIAILLFVVVVAAIAIGGSYNRLVRLQQAVDQSWAQVQNVYQRRADLIPNLVNTVSGAANFEKSTLVEVTNARASVGRVQMSARRRCTTCAVSSRTGTVEQRPVTFASRLGALSRIKSEPELSESTGAIGRNREPNFRRARQLQQDGAGLQRGGAQFPDKFDRGHARFSAETVLHCATGRGKTPAGAVQFWLARSGARSDSGAIM